MTVPTGADATKYADRLKQTSYRCVLGLSTPQWTAAVTELFGAADLDEALWSHSEPQPSVSGGELLIRGHGLPPFEWAMTTPKWFPTRDLTKGFELEINATFPVVSPGYTTMISTVSLDGGRSKVADPFSVIQMGEDYGFYGAFGVGDIEVRGPLGVTYRLTNDQLTHEYIMQWDPDGGADGGGQLTIKVDGTIRIGPIDNDDFTESGTGVVDEAWIVRPYAVTIGVISSYDADVTPAGTPSSPVNIIEIQDVVVRQLGAEGYESAFNPSWTTANAGGDIDDAALGERFDLDSETWAKLPGVITFEVAQGRDNDADAFTVTLAGADAADPSIPNTFKDTHWFGRPILIDTNVADSAGAAIGWKRLICGVVERVSTQIRDGQVVVILNGRDRTSVKLDTELTRSYTDAVASSATGVINVGFNIDAIFEDIVAVSDASWDSDELGDTDMDIQGPPDLTPEALSSGPNLLGALNSIVDEIGCELFRRYTVAGAGRYGQVVIAKWTIGGELDSSATKFTLNGQGGSGTTNIADIVLNEDMQEGVGQVVVAADNMFQTSSFLSAGEPGPGDHPRMPYPLRARELHRSLAEGESSIFGSLPLLRWVDQDGDFFLGGPGKHSWFRENANRRRAGLRLIDHDWPQPTDEVVIDDPDHTGLATTESWVVNAVKFTFSDGVLVTALDLLTQDVVSAVRSQL